MIQGMTGFAASFISLTCGTEKAQASLQLKTLNSRYFEANIKLPSALSFLEIELNKRFKTRLQRGYIYFTLYIDNPVLFKGSISPSLSAAQEYIQAIAAIKAACQLEDPITLPMLLKLPNLFFVQENQVDDQITQQLMHLVDQLIERVIAEREKEGLFIKEDLLKRMDLMTKDIDYIEHRSAQMIEEQKERVATVIKELSTDESELAEARKNAVFTILDKIDIHEEIVRFKNHLKQLQHFLETPSMEKGKRVDFTLQEMAREVNTIAAKCSDSSISSHAIDIKVELEKAREQAQNLV